VFYNNIVRDNVVGKVSEQVDPNDPTIYLPPPSREGSYRYDSFGHLPGCAGADASKCTNNVILPDPITSATEANEYALWQQKLRDNGITVGPVSQISGLVASILPISRSVQTAGTATVFATIINTRADSALRCSISPISLLPIASLYQTTNRFTNQLTGLPNQPVDIAPGDFQTFFIAITATVPFAPSDIALSFGCANRGSAVIIPGVNTMLLSASDSPVPDIVALGLTPSGDGIVNIPGSNGTGIFSVATSNVGGAGGAITASADTGGVSLPVNLFVCRTDPGTGACLPPGLQASVTVTINPGQTPTFAVFAQGAGTIPFSPGANRVFLRFRDGGNAVRGATSAALRTQ
jgi:hypothetical protein